MNLHPPVPILRDNAWRPRPLLTLAIAVVAGAVGGRLLSAPWTDSLAVPAWCLAAVTLVAWWWTRPRSDGRLSEALLVASAVLVGAAWSTAQFDLFDRGDVAWQLGDVPVPIALRGRVVASPRPLAPPVDDVGRPLAMGPSSEFHLVVEAVRDGAIWRPAAGRATVVVHGEPIVILAGTRTRIFGRGLRPSRALNPGEPDFALRARAERRLSLVRVDAWSCVEMESVPRVWSPTAVLDRARIAAGGVLAAGIAPQRAGLAAALMLGDRSLPPTLVHDFVVTGTIHVLAISGLHVGLLAAGLFLVLRRLVVPAGVALAVVAATIGLYAMLVGGGTPVVRATLMVWSGCLASAASRRPAAINSLALAAIALVAWRPAEVFAVGTQLSYLSTAVLVGAASLAHRPRRLDPIDRLVERSRGLWERRLRTIGRWFAVEATCGLAVWLATAPLVAAWFNVVSPVALPANLLIAPLVPVAMAGGFLCLTVAPISISLASWFAAVCDMALAVIGAVVACAAAVPAGHVWVPGPATWWVVGWYALFAAVLLWLHRDLLARPITWAVLVVGWAAVGLIAGLLADAVRPVGPGLRIVATAVGHGCGLVVRSATGRCLLYDAGRLGGPAAARRALAAVLWSERVGRLDTIVVSHDDADHHNAVPDLLARFPTGEIVVSEAFLRGGSNGAATLLAAAAARGVPVRTVRAGDAFAIDPLCRVRVLHPAGCAGPVDALPSDNASSLVLSLEAAGRRVLLTGDLDGETLAGFVASSPGACDVLFAPHHGSRTSLPADIARVTRPAVVIASGRGGPAWPEVRDAYAAAAGVQPEFVLTTGCQGALAVSLTASTVAVERFTDGGWRSLSDVGGQPVASRGAEMNSQPAANRISWLATYAPSNNSTPLVKP